MDTVPVKKTVNRVKAPLDKRKGPARKEQDAAPIADAIRDYWDRGMLTFGIPAHNGGRGPAPGGAGLSGLGGVRGHPPAGPPADGAGTNRPRGLPRRPADEPRRGHARPLVGGPDHRSAAVRRGRGRP